MLVAPQLLQAHREGPRQADPGAVIDREVARKGRRQRRSGKGACHRARVDGVDPQVALTPGVDRRCGALGLFEVKGDTGTVHQGIADAGGGTRGVGNIVVAGTTDHALLDDDFTNEARGRRGTETQRERRHRRRIVGVVVEACVLRPVGASVECRARSVGEVDGEVCDAAEARHVRDAITILVQPILPVLFGTRIGIGIAVVAVVAPHRFVDVTITVAVEAIDAIAVLVRPVDRTVHRSRVHRIVVVVAVFQGDGSVTVTILRVRRGSRRVVVAVLKRRYTIAVGIQSHRRGVGGVVVAVL